MDTPSGEMSIPDYVEPNLGRSECDQAGSDADLQDKIFLSQELAEFLGVIAAALLAAASGVVVLRHPIEFAHARRSHEQSARRWSSLAPVSRRTARVYEPIVCSSVRSLRQFQVRPKT